MAIKKMEGMASINLGYRKFVMPAEVAMEIFRLMSGVELFELHEGWELGVGSVKRMDMMDPENLPTMSVISPAFYHLLAQNQIAWQEREDEKQRIRKEKDAGNV